MKHLDYKGEWAGCSDFRERIENARKSHEEFQASELKKMLDEGWKVQSARVKRPRIKKTKTPKQVVVSLGEGWTLKLSFSDYLKSGDGLKIIMRIY